MVAYAAYDEIDVWFCNVVFRYGMRFQFVMALVARVVFVATFEFEGNDVQGSVPVLTPGLFVDEFTVYSWGRRDRHWARARVVRWGWWIKSCLGFVD